MRAPEGAGGATSGGRQGALLRHLVRSRQITSYPLDQRLCRSRCLSRRRRHGRRAGQAGPPAGAALQGAPPCAASSLEITPITEIIMHKTGPFTNSGVSKFVKLVVVYTKHQQLNKQAIKIVAINATQATLDQLLALIATIFKAMHVLVSNW